MTSIFLLLLEADRISKTFYPILFSTPSRVETLGRSLSLSGADYAEGSWGISLLYSYSVIIGDEMNVNKGKWSSGVECNVSIGRLSNIKRSQSRFHRRGNYKSTQLKYFLTAKNIFKKFLGTGEWRLESDGAPAIFLLCIRLFCAKTCAFLSQILILFLSVLRLVLCHTQTNIFVLLLGKVKDFFFNSSKAFSQIFFSSKKKRKFIEAPHN